MAKISLGTAVTDSNGIARLVDGYTGTGAGEVDVSAEVTISGSTVQSEPYEVLDCTFIDYGTSSNHQTWRNESATNYSRNDTATTITSSTSFFPRLEKTISGDFEATFYASMTNAIRLAMYSKADGNNQITWNLTQTDELLYRVKRINGVWTVQHSTDNGTTWSSAYTKLYGDLTTEDVYFGFIFSTSTERSITFHDLRVYPI